MIDLMQWIRAQITEDEVQASDPHLDEDRRRGLLAQIEAHTGLLNLIEQTAGPNIELKSDHDTDVFGRMFVALKMHDFVGVLAIFYRDRPGYDEAVAEFALTSPQVKVGKSDELKADELAARRLRATEPQPE